MKGRHGSPGIAIAATLLAAIALALGAAGTASAQTASTSGDSGLRTAQRALEIAQQANKRAGLGVSKGREALEKGKQALQKARQAMNKGREAVQDAAAALAAANQANARLDSAEPVTAAANGVVSTTNELQYVSLGGPELTATVPDSGLIEVWASVRFEDPADGLVSLFEDGQEVEIPGQEGLCGTPDIESAWLSAQLGGGIAITLSTPPALVFFGGCGTIGGAPGPVLLERSPGEHTYELRYADCGCDPGAASFSNRSLIVAGRP